MAHLLWERLPSIQYSFIKMRLFNLLTSQAD